MQRIFATWVAPGIAIAAALRPASYITLQVTDFVAKLTNEDIVNIVAYMTSRSP